MHLLTLIDEYWRPCSVFHKCHSSIASNFAAAPIATCTLTITTTLLSASIIDPMAVSDMYQLFESEPSSARKSCLIFGVVNKHTHTRTRSFSIHAFVRVCVYMECIQTQSCQFTTTKALQTKKPTSNIWALTAWLKDQKATRRQTCPIINVKQLLDTAVSFNKTHVRSCY